jgi:hypothetical protein
MNRREMLFAMAASGAGMLAPQLYARPAFEDFLNSTDERFLDELERRACLYFWEQASPISGQILDRARNDSTGSRDDRRMASIAATGFGLTGLCIADARGYLPHSQVVERVRTALDFHLNRMPEVRGFFYHFTEVDTGARMPGTELSSVDTALLMCGVLTARAYFADKQIRSMAHQLYERVDWVWMLNGGNTFSMGWKPESGFLESRWNHYCELMMIYLLAIGSPTHAIPADCWNQFSRPVMRYKGLEYISGHDPLFTHQYSQAWFDFRGVRDAYANYYENSVTATRAHKAFCLSLPQWYSDDYWGITASDWQGGYTAWGGPPVTGPLDGSVVPSAAAGSLPFLPTECIAVLRAMRARWGDRAWGRYGFVDAFHPSGNWYDGDVLGINQGISLLMAENLRSGFVWNTFMQNPECTEAMRLAGFHKETQLQALITAGHTSRDR